MLHAGLDLSRRRLDVCLLGEGGQVLAETAVPPDADGLRGLAGRLAGLPVRAVIESMNGARFVHDTLEELGWEVLVADAEKVKGVAPLGGQDRQGRRSGSRRVSWRDVVPAIWLPDPTIRRERELDPQYPKLGEDAIRGLQEIKRRLEADAPEGAAADR